MRRFSDGIKACQKTTAAARVQRREVSSSPSSFRTVHVRRRPASFFTHAQLTIRQRLQRTGSKCLRARTITRKCRKRLKGDGEGREQRGEKWCGWSEEEERRISVKKLSMTFQRPHVERESKQSARANSTAVDKLHPTAPHVKSEGSCPSRDVRETASTTKVTRYGTRRAGCWRSSKRAPATKGIYPRFRFPQFKNGGAKIKARKMTDVTADGNMTATARKTQD